MSRPNSARKAMVANMSPLASPVASPRTRENRGAMVFAGAPAIVAAAIPPTPPPQAAKPRRTTGSTELQASDEHHHTEQVLDSSDTAQGTWDGSQDDYTKTQRAIELVSKMRAHMQLLQQQRDEAVRQLKFRDVTIRKLQVQLHQAESRIQDVQVREKMGTSISSRLGEAAGAHIRGYLVCCNRHRTRAIEYLGANAIVRYGSWSHATQVASVRVSE